MKISELFSEPSRWTQHTYARDAATRRCSARSDSAVCWCLTGALVKCYGGDVTRYAEAEDKVRRALTARGEAHYIVEWNDSPLRTFAEVKALVEQADV